MKLRATAKRYRLQFKEPAGTSRAVYQTRDVHLITLQRGFAVGFGECAPLPGLSCDDLPDYDERLREALLQLEQTGQINGEALRPYPSILFGLETALRHLERESLQLWETPFSRGEAGIHINGLIWMGSKREMLQRVEQKLEAGFSCLKLKIGALKFKEELELLRHIRRHFSPNELELRVDANGAFRPSEAMDKLHWLADEALHSIEQPIAAGQWEEMARLCAATPLPIALDEELIGIHTPEAKRALLETIRPQYLILKPSLHGALVGCDEWVALATELQLPWWVTSALESNIGLNAIAQWAASHRPTLPQGLGTGALYTNNIPLPLELRGQALWFNPAVAADFTSIV